MTRAKSKKEKLSENMLHATAVSIDGQGVLLLGPSGVGKSDLALQLIDEGATLIADDRVFVEPQGADLIASAPEILRGALEIRGIGVLQLPHEQWIPIRLAVQMVPPSHTLERYPDAQEMTQLGVTVPLIYTAVSYASATASIRAVLKYPRVETLHEVKSAAA